MNEPIQQQIQHVKPVMDGLAVIGWISALTGMLTSVFGLLAAILSFAWCAIRVYETDFVQTWLKKRRRR
jgi:ABC-type Na+ efflux pump permease subunit